MHKTFWFCHAGALGDVILAWPAWLSLKKCYPSHAFIGVGRKTPMALARALGLIEGFVDAESRDCVDFFAGRSLPRGVPPPEGAVLWLKRGGLVAELIRRGAALPVVWMDPAPSGRNHIAGQYCAVLSRTFPVEPPEPLFRDFPEARRPDGPICIMPGSGSSDKNFSPDLYRRISFGLKPFRPDVAFVMGPAERERGLPSRFAGERLFFPADAVELAEILKTASCFIGNDSGPSHLAGYLGVPTVVLYKSTDPSVWGVVGRNAVHVTAKTDDEALMKTAVQIQRLLRIGVSFLPSIER